MKENISRPLFLMILVLAVVFKPNSTSYHVLQLFPTTKPQLSPKVNSIEKVSRARGDGHKLVFLTDPDPPVSTPGRVFSPGTRRQCPRIISVDSSRLDSERHSLPACKEGPITIDASAFRARSLSCDNFGKIR